MIKLTWEQIRSAEFNPLLNRILQTKMPFETAKRILGIIKEIQVEQEKSDKAWAEIAEKYLEPIQDTGGKLLRMKNADDKDANKEIADFHATPVEIQKPRLTPAELFHVELSPRELYALEGLVGDEP